MKFSVSHVGKTGGRLGIISLEKSATGTAATLETPFSLTYTRGGSVPHLIPEVLERLGWRAPTVLQAPLASQAALQPVLEEFGAGYRAFAGLEGILYSCNHDPMVATPSGYNDKKGISVWPRGGRTSLDAAKFMALQAAVRPDWLELLCDSDTPADASKKRQRKSVERSAELLDECLELKEKYPALSETILLVPLVGGHVLDDRVRSARAASDKPLDGYVLEGLVNGPESLLLPSVDRIAQLVRDTLAEVPQDKPRLLHGAWRPLHVLRLVQAGADVFDSSYPSMAAERGAALVFPLTAAPGKEDRSNSDDVTNAESLTAPYEISLDDKRFREDGAPLVAGCECYTCSNHSRAYIHHLISVKELLASVLLSLHNLYHWSSFFASLRAALADGSVAQLAECYERLESPAPA